MALLLLVFLSLISTATSEGVFLPLERRFNTDEVEMRELRARDRIRHGRMLQQQSGVIDFPLQGSSISSDRRDFGFRVGLSEVHSEIVLVNLESGYQKGSMTLDGCATIAEYEFLTSEVYLSNLSTTVVYLNLYSWLINKPWRSAKAICSNLDVVLRIYYTRIRLGSPPKEFHVQIDTGSDVLWVSCISCKGCPTLGGIDQSFGSDVEAFEDWSLDAPSMEDKTNEKEKRNGVGANAINNRICDVCSRAASKGMLSWQARSDIILSKVMTSCDLWFNFESDTGTWGKICPCEGTENRSLMEDQMLKYVAKSIHGVQESISSDLSEIRILVQELAGQVISSGAQNLVPDMSGGPALAPRTLRHKPSRVELDHFHGVNPEAWIFKAERYFELNGIADTHKLSIASIYLDGDALKWFQWLNRNGQFIDWKHFIEKLIIHFQNRYGCATQSTAKIFRSDFASTLDDKNAYHMFDKLAVKCAIIDSLASFTGNDTEIETPNDMETPLIGNVELVQIDLVYGPSSIVEDAVFDEISHTIVTSDIHDLNTIFHEGAHFVTTAAKVYDTEELDIGVLTDAMTSSLNRAQPKELIEHALPVTCLFRSLIFALENRWMEFLPSSQLDQWF
ncbi:hypothetical protein FXO38_22274 [Capsicum annuum]|nr:hypothetical protein FXO38_22274 [Capsicum annuum]